MMLGLYVFYPASAQSHLASRKESQFVYAPADYVISANPGFVPDINYNGTGLTLDNPADILTLTCNGIVIDSRNYTLASSGSSSSLSNNGNAKWCDNLVNIYNGDSGTPGAANINCP